MSLIWLFLLASTLGPAQTADSHPAFAAPSSTETAEVIHCLKAGDMDWTANSTALEKADAFVVGLRHDRTAYNHQNHVIVVVFENALRGDVFDLTRKDDGGRRIYKVENNGEFKMTGNRIDWPGEALGGNWTHDYLERNIRKIMRGPRVTVPLKSLIDPLPNITCTSYVFDRP